MSTDKSMRCVKQVHLLPPERLQWLAGIATKTKLGSGYHPVADYKPHSLPRPPLIFSMAGTMPR